MLVIIKLDTPDIQTFEIGNNIGIRTGLLQIVFSPEAAKEFARDVRHVMRQRRKDQAAQDNKTPALDYKCQACGKSLGGSLWGVCSPECLEAILKEKPPCGPRS